MYVCVYVCMCVCMYVCVYVCMYVCMYVSACLIARILSNCGCDGYQIVTEQHALRVTSPFSGCAMTWLVHETIFAGC